MAELGELKKRGRAFKRAVARLADEHSGVDYVSHGILQPLAKAVLADRPVALKNLAAAAEARAKELRQHPRVQTDKEPLRLFGYFLREIFKAAAAPHLKPPIDNGWHHCREFAKEVFSIAGIDTANFDAHPERLTEYLGADL